MTEWESFCIIAKVSSVKVFPFTVSKDTRSQKEELHHGKNLEISVLLDYYGQMLTEKQREVARLYYNEDLSLAEIGPVCKSSPVRV